MDLAIYFVAQLETNLGRKLIKWNVLIRTRKKEKIKFRKI